MIDGVYKNSQGHLLVQCQCSSIDHLIALERDDDVVYIGVFFPRSGVFQRVRTIWKMLTTDTAYHNILIDQAACQQIADYLTKP
jgi:hypothetical protein